GQQKKCSVIAQVGLVLRDHPTGEGEMKRPGRADDGVKQPAVGLNVEKNAERAVNGDGEDAVEREEIWRERDPKIGAVGDDVATVTANAETTDAAAHPPGPDRMRECVPENV